MRGTFIEFKAGQKHPAKDADQSDTPDVFQDCGYVLTDDDVVIDIDHLSKDQIREYIKRFGVKTQIVWTDRGAHLYFKKPDSFTRARQGVSGLGFEYEMKTSKNQLAVTIKRNGKLRAIENENAREVLPWYFYSTKKFTDLTGLSEGDGRNVALFTHKNKLGNIEGAGQILRFINEVIFADPLSDQEFDTLVSRPVETTDTSETRAASELIIKQCHTVIWQKRIYWLSENGYISDSEDRELRRVIMTKYPNKETRFADEVIKQVYIMSECQDGAIFPIKFKNGILLNGAFIHLKGFDEFTPYSINIEYDENAEPVPEVDEYLGNITDHDPDYRNVWLEAMGYPLVTNPEVIRSIGKFFFLRGDGANGKGTMLQIMRRIYGWQNCTANSPREIADERYLVSMSGKLANLGDDIEPDAIDNKTMRTLKNIATADTVSIRQLYKQASEETMICKMFFTTNADVKTWEKSYAYKRRVMWLPMFNKVASPDSNFITRMTSDAALRYWIRLIVEGYQRLVNNRGFSECQRIDEYNREYHIKNNYMAEFIESLDVETDIIGQTPKEIRAMYDEYNDDDSKKYSPKLLNDALQELGIVCAKKLIPETRRSKRVYMRSTDTTQRR